MVDGTHNLLICYSPNYNVFRIMNRMDPKIHCESKMPDKIFKINECCICLLDPPGIVFSCGHLICCKNCSDKYKEKTCPLCKGYITDRIIYSGSYNLDVD